MLKLFNKEKKKAPQIQNVLTIEEFFKRDEYEINDEFWKMNATQLEETCKKQEKYIKKLKTLYAAHLDYLEQLLIKHEEEKKKLRTEIEEWQIKNQSNFELKQQIEVQYQQMYEQFSTQSLQQKQPQIIEEHKQEPQNTDLLELVEPKEEEIERLRLQCIKVCEEMRRLQEDNDDLSTALDAEKQHKEQLRQQFEQQKVQFQQEISELENKIKNIQNEGQTNFQKLEDKIRNQKDLEQNISELSNKIHELDSKLLQEKIKVDQKNKDCIRLEDQINELKNQIEQMSNQINIQKSKLQLLETKRQKDKVTINELKNNIALSQNNIELIQFQQKNELQNLNLQINELQLKSNLYDQLKVQYDQLQNQLMDKNVKVQQLFHQISDMEQQIEQKNKQQQNKDEIQIQKDIERENLIQHLTLKRENARVEIEQLNDKIISLMKLVDSIKSKASQNNDIQQIIKHNSDILNKSEMLQKSNRRIQLFPTLHKCLTELRKLEDKCYKLYIQTMISDFQNKDSTIQIERYLNDIGRRSQEIIDLLDEMGLK
ncbi:unnamed protein product [Paramecium pentaurelia]|uniref:Uncharacterized protein n=1 Tax=Paramecium pentaurelia TaxID=43138 RepID=A0A8S1WAB9_9CILI|nr:unnamed protein product [Paramecium pentaurelia]